MKRFNSNDIHADMPYIYCDKELLEPIITMPKEFYKETMAPDWSDGCERPNVVILHHDDADGLCSAGTIYVFEKTLRHSDITMHCISDYDVNPEIYAGSITNADIVYLVDLSFKQHQIDYLVEHSNVFVWIDHHYTSSLVHIDDKFSNRVFKYIHSEVGVSAAALCWIYVYYMYDLVTGNYEVDDENGTLIFCTDYDDGIDLVPIPDIIKTVSLHDTFHPDANHEFSFGIYSSGFNLNPDGAWLDMIDPYFKRVANCYTMPDKNAFRLAEKTFDDILNNGRASKRWAESFYERYRKENLIKFYLRVINRKDGTDEVYRIAAMNIDANSLSFGDVYYQVDGVLKFTQTSNGTYKYSMYAHLENEHHINCAQIAMSFGGGGHVGAAGWTSKENLVEKFIKNDYVIYI